MSEVLQCSSCGGTNQLPAGKNSMFCTFCGNIIQKPNKYTESASKLLAKPEVDFETNPYLDLNIHLRTDLGIISLKKKGISSFDQISKWYTDKELDEIGYLILDGNKLSSLEGIELFSSLRGIDLSNNNFEIFEYDLFPKNLSFVKLNGNDLKELPIKFIASRASSKIWLLDNPFLSMNNLSLQDFDANKVIELLNNGELEYYSDYSGGYESIAKELVSPMSEKHIYQMGLHRTETFVKGMKEMYKYKFQVWINGSIAQEIESSNFKLEKLQKDGWFLFSLLNNPLGINQIFQAIEPLLPNAGYVELLMTHSAGLSLPDKNKTKEKVDRMFKKIKGNLDNSSVNKNKNNSNKHGDGKCFIATATFGSYNHPQVIELRKFRDEFLLTRKWGESFVESYYRYGNIPANIIQENYLIKWFCYLTVIIPLLNIVRLLKFLKHGKN
jgi:hypothetical protein